MLNALNSMMNLNGINGNIGEKHSMILMKRDELNSDVLGCLHVKNMLQTHRPPCEFKNRAKQGRDTVNRCLCVNDVWSERGQCMDYK